MQPFEIRRPVKHFIANGEARSTADAEGLRKREILAEMSTDVGGLHVHLETVDIEPTDFGDLKDFALIKWSAQFVKRAVKRDVFALLVAASAALAAITEPGPSIGYSL